MTLHFTKEPLDFVPFGCYTNYTGAIKKISSTNLEETILVLYVLKMSNRNMMQNNVFPTVERIYLNYKYSLRMQFSENIKQAHLVHKIDLFNNKKKALRK